LVSLVLTVVAIVVLAAGYALGARRSRGREKALRTTIDDQSGRLTLVEQELLRRSNLDPVTELPVQEVFQEFLEREWRRAVRERVPLSVIVAEVDHFRAYNERLGKARGDACLKTVADALRRSVRRPGDLLARYGAGRFGVVLGGADEQGAMALAEMLRACVDLLKVSTPVSPTSSTLTLSVGVASVRPERDAAWQDIELIAAAERGLAQAAEGGRNRVVLASFDADSPRR
jgi:diguanylate cyclase (GGDEF)-like protein